MQMGYAEQENLVPSLNIKISNLESDIVAAKFILQDFINCKDVALLIPLAARAQKWLTEIEEAYHGGL
jgi:hypothetical protein